MTISSNSNYLLPRFKIRIQHYTIWHNLFYNIVAFGVIIILGKLLLWELSELNLPISRLQDDPINLDPVNLFSYCFRTLLRMLIAIVFSFIFSFLYATIAAKSERLAKVLIPMLDLFQSIPILGYISLTVTSFLALFPGSVLGAEIAAIFAIFTSQVWNMTFSMYYSFKNVPHELLEVSKILHLTKWQRFWRVEMPYTIPNLSWNACISMSNGWFFVVASEIITVGNTKIMLPGVGSYIGLAIEQQDMIAITCVVFAMICTILIYNHLLLRPLLTWSDKFLETLNSNNYIKHKPLALVIWLENSFICTKLYYIIKTTAYFMIYLPVFNILSEKLLFNIKPHKKLDKFLDLLWYSAIFMCVVYVCQHLFKLLYNNISTFEILHILQLSAFTTMRIFIMLILVSFIWVPVGVYIGMRPKLAIIINPILQFAASFPINLMFPVSVVIITYYELEPSIWLSPLIIFGSQWYILFNVISGTIAIPQELREVSKVMNIKGFLWWRKIIVPSIAPYLLTGCITAAGGAWNASIIAEMVTFGDITLSIDGIGSYITKATIDGNYSKIISSILIMAFIVLLINRILWQPLHNYINKKYHPNVS